MLLPLAFLTGPELLWSAIAFGLVFGFLLHRGGVTDFDVIVMAAAVADCASRE